ncbi:MAG: 30S ribosomal protein S6 [Nitrospirota bacterium]
MPHYETMVLVKPSISDEEVGGITEKLRGLLTKAGGQVTHAVQWGKKKLAYEIGKEKKAVYIIFRFDAEGAAVKEFERACRLDEQIMRVMTVAMAPDQAVPVAAAPAPVAGGAPAESHD